MTVLTHQVEELTRAISQVINTENTKARLEVFRVIEAGQAASKNPAEILCDVLDWVKGDSK